MPRPKRSRLKLPPAEYEKLKIKILQRDGYKCRVRWCKSREKLHVHHIVFRSNGGDDAEWNLITLCSQCHDAVHERWLLIVSPFGTDQPVDAGKGVKFIFVNGWRPSRE